MVQSRSTTAKPESMVQLRSTAAKPENTVQPESILTLMDKEAVVISDSDEEASTKEDDTAWVTISKNGLKQSDKKALLQEGTFLSDTHFNTIQEILKAQFQHIHGF